MREEVAAPLCTNPRLRHIAASSEESNDDTFTLQIAVVIIHAEGALQSRACDGVKWSGHKQQASLQSFQRDRS